MNTLVVGAGAMGRWFGRILLDVDTVSSVAFLDTDPAAADDAATDVGGIAVEPPVETTADLVCIAVPIPAATDAIETYADSADRAIVDLTGTMAGPVAAMRAHAPALERLSLHPLFAPDSEPGNVPAVVDSGGPITDAILEGLADRGNTVFETDTETHDEMMETVQARTHAAILAYAMTAEDVPDRYQTPVSAELTKLADRVTDGEARVYADIQAAFDGADSIADAARELADATDEQFLELYTRARVDDQ